MAIRILTKNAVDNTNIDGARDFNFNSGRRSGIVKGALNEGNFFTSSSNTIALDACELRLCGHRIVIDEVEYITLVNKPSSPVRYSLISEVIVDDDTNVLFNLFIQSSSTILIQDNLDINGIGKFQLEIGKFTLLTDGTITDVIRTADLITGSGTSDYNYIRIGDVKTNKISPELDADVDIENVVDETDNKPKTNFTFNLPTQVGTVVSLDGEEQTSINTDLTPKENSNNLITSGGIYYPVTFAETERQKSKNLLNPQWLKQGAYVFTTGTFSYDANYVTTEKISVKPNSQIVVSSNIGIDSDSGFVFFNDGVYVGYAGSGAVTATVPSNANQVVFDFHAIGITPASLTTPQLEYGSVATDYQPYNGAIVHKNDIADVEHIETIYDKDSSDTNINLGYTSGIHSESYVSMDLTKYKMIRVYGTLYDRTEETSCNRNTVVLLDLKSNRVTRNNETMSLTTNRFSYFNGNVFNITQPFDVVYYYSHTNHTFNCIFAYDGEMKYEEYYYVYKIEGVY